MVKPKVAITIGDPAGIGPEIVYRATNSLKVQRVCSPVVVGDKNVISKYFNIYKNSNNIEFVFSSDYNKNIKIGKPSKISSILTKKDIVSTTKLSADFIKQILKKNPKIMMCALNPHAGDNGILGNDEKETIIPAIKHLKKENYNIVGLYPVDVAWQKFLQNKYDLIVAMYHDQIMLPLKILNPKKIVNVTVGLPFIRTSPGHGTAFDIAGKNIADFSSMEEAIIYASK